MSATMDSDLFASYLHCPHLTTEGRTFPVTVKYLEEVYEELQYSLDPDSDAAFHPGSSRNTLKASIQDKASSKLNTFHNFFHHFDSRSEKNLLGANWGDDGSFSPDTLNRNYDPEIYSSN